MNARIPHLTSSSIWYVMAAALAVVLAGCSEAAKTERTLKRANEYFQKGQYKEAKIEYANVLRLDPMNAVAIKNLGIIWSEQGAPMRALPFLLRTMKDVPTDLETRTRVATSLLALDARAEAANTAAAILREQSGHAKALVLLADAARLPGEITQVRERIDQFPDKGSASYHLAHGALLVKTGEVKKGEEALKEAERLDPKDPLPHLALASLALGRKQPDAALEQFQIASKLANPRSLPALASAVFLFQSSRLKEASNAVKPVVEAAPDYLPARQIDAQISFAMGDKPAAKKQLQELLRQDPENLEGAVLQSQVWMADGENEKAGDLLDRLNKRFPKYPLIRFELARCANAAGNSDRAIQLLDELVRTNPDYAQAVLVLNELRLRKGDARTAVAGLESFCNARQTYPPAEVLLAQGYRAIGRQTDAVAIYRKLLEGPNNRQSLHFLIGQTLREMKQDSEAVQSFEEALKLDPSNLAPLAYLIDIDLGRKDYTRALKRLSDHTAEGAPSAETLFLQGRVEMAQSQWAAAERTLRKAAELNPSLIGVYEALLNVYVATDRLKEAGEQAEKLCARKPDDVSALANLARIKNRLGESDAAIKAYEKLLALKPDSAIAINNLACLHMEQAGQLDKAYTLARRARELQPDNPGFADTLGWVSFKRREYTQALALLQESANQLPEHAEVVFHLGMACYAMGRAEQAISSLKTAADLPEAFPGKAEIPIRLALLTKANSYDIGTLTEMGKKNADDVYVWYRLGGLLRESQDFSGAASAFQKGIDINPQMLPCLLELAALNAGPLKRPEAAADLMRQASKLASGDPVSCAIAGKMALQMHDWARAYNLLSEGSRGPGEKAQLSVPLAKAAYALGKTDEATELMSGIVSDGPSEQRPDAQRFLQLLKATDDVRAVAADSLQKEPDNVLALMAVGTIERRQGKLSEAKARFVRTLQLVPEFPLAQKQLAAIYLEDPSQASKAHELASRARRALPGDSELAEILAETSFRQKEYGYARQLFEERSQKEPLKPKSLYMLGVCCWEQKSPEAAAVALRKALEGGVSGTMRSEAERLLKLCEEPKSTAQK